VKPPNSPLRLFLISLVFLPLAVPFTSGAKTQQSNEPDPATKIIELRQRAGKLIDEDRTGDAAQLLQQAVDLEDQHISYYGVMAREAAARGEWRSAITATTKNLKFLERLDRPNSVRLVPFLSNLVLFCTSAGDYVRADYYLQRLLPFVAGLTDNPPNNPGLAVVFHNIGAALASRGQYSKAEVFYQALLRIRENDPNSIALVDALNGIALLHKNMNDTKSAETYLTRALQILDAKRPLVTSLSRLNPNAGKPFDAARANVLDSLAFIEHANGSYDLAAQNYVQAIQLADAALGADSITAAAYRQNLALLRKDQKNYVEAETLYQTVRGVMERKLGSNHPEVAKVDGNLAMLYMARGDVAKALSSLTSNLNISEHNWSLSLSIGSETQKNAFVNMIGGYLDSVISFHTRLAPENPDALRLALTTTLRRKGRRLDVLADTLNTLRTRVEREDVSKFDQLTKLRSQLAALVMQSRDADSPEGFKTRIDSLTQLVEQMESDLAQKYAELRLLTAPTTIDEVQQLIPNDAALVEIVSYRPIDPKASVFETSRRWGPERYVAYILTNQGQPDWVELKTNRSEIDDAVLALRGALRSQSPDSQFRPIARRVYDEVFGPIVGKLSNKREILISPDGALNLLPFAALIDPQNHFAVEKYCFTYLTSGRDLFRLQARNQSVQPPVIVADPVFDKTDDVRVDELDKAERLSSDFHQQFDRLAATAQEATELNKLLKDAVSLINTGATETAIKRVNRPSILHIATHGFFLPNQPAVDPSGSSESSPQESVSAITENGLLRAGLALTGANKFSGGNGEDGILTAYEISSLDLRGTQLVVLSACETGLGDLQNGEGVYGLRRAFLLAGAQSELVTLWRVNSQATTSLIENYYRHLACGEGRSKALQHVQTEMLTQHPYFWAGFVPIGQWDRVLDGVFQPIRPCSP
jgi:CHAT domain-containing protein